MKWISVKDELPKDNADRLLDVFTPEGERVIDVKFDNGNFMQLVYPDDFDGGMDVILIHWEDIDIKNVTHWLIPEPPEGE